MTWSSAQMWTPEHEPDGVEEPDEVELSPYMAEQLVHLDRLRDETGTVPHSADG